MLKDQKNFYFYLKRLSLFKKDNIFLYDETERYSAYETLQEVRNAANELYKLGIRKQDITALRATRSIHTVIIIYALQLIGSAVVLCDPHNKLKNVLEGANTLVEASFYITNEDSDTSTNAKNGFLVKDADGLAIGRIDFTHSKKEVALDFEVNTDTHKTAVIIFTSGSTGKNKAVMMSQYNYINHLKNLYKTGCYKKSDIACCILPLYHVFGFAITLMAVKAQYSMFFPKTEKKEYIAKCIQNNHLTRLDSVPSYLYSLAGYLEANKISIDSLRVGYLGGSPSSVSQFIYIENILKMKLIPVYGMSECISISAGDAKDSAKIRSSCVGKPLKLCDVKIISEDGKELPYDVVGEITSKGPSVMMGYYHDEKEDAKALKEGRLYTGDLGFIDNKGYLHIVGRKKDIIIRNGNNISSVKISRAISDIEGVANCETVRLNDEKEGEVPGCIIRLSADITLSEDELIKKISKILQKNEIPKIIKIVDNIPLGSTGKPDRIKIEEILKNG